MRDEWSVDRRGVEAVPGGEEARGRDERALSRRTAMAVLAMGAGAAAVGVRTAVAQTPTGPVAPPSTVTNPPRDFGPNGAPTTYFTDPDVLSVDPLFDNYRQPNTSIVR